MYQTGGTAMDYANHIDTTIRHMAKVHSLLQEEPEEGIYRRMVSNVKNTLTDRAPVNAAAINRLNDQGYNLK